jgi:AP-1 complex subunit mu
MTYRTLHPAKPLININATMSSTNSSRIEYAVSLSTLFKEQNIASNIQVEIPVSPDTTSPEIQCSCGTVVYDPEKDALLWTLRNIKGKREFKLQAKLCVPSTGIVTQSPGMTPVRVTFEIPYNTASGLQVKYLKVVEKDGYSALPWVRYITRSNGYEFRFRK